jgi:hypothetical protein
VATKKMRTIGGVLGTGATLIYTAPTGTDVVVVTLRVVNVGTVSANYSFSIAGKDCAKAIPLQPGTVDVHVEGQPMFLQPGETISGLATIAATAAITASVIERDAL